jgi:hypothetical protein
VEGILISFPVCGFLPVLALLLATEKVPNPVKASLSPFFNALVTLLVNALMAFSADAFEILASFPMLAINSAFVIVNHLLLLGEIFSMIENGVGLSKTMPIIAYQYFKSQVFIFEKFNFFIRLFSVIQTSVIPLSAGDAEGRWGRSVRS